MSGRYGARHTPPRNSWRHSQTIMDDKNSNCQDTSTRPSDTPSDTISASLQEFQNSLNTIWSTSGEQIIRGAKSESTDSTILQNTIPSLSEKDGRTNPGNMEMLMHLVSQSSTEMCKTIISEVSHAFSVLIQKLRDLVCPLLDTFKAFVQDVSQWWTSMFSEDASGSVEKSLSSTRKKTLSTSWMNTAQRRRDWLRRMSIRNPSLCNGQSL